MARSSDFNFQIKGTARQAVTGHLGTTVGSILFYCITALLLSNITVSIFPGSDVGSTIGFEAVNFIIQLFLGLLAYGINYQHLLLVYGQNTTFGDLFAGFRRGVNDRVIKVTAVLALISFCCTLPATLVMSTCADAAEMIEKMYIIAPLYIAGIILDIWFTLSFSQCYYLLADFETLGAKRLPAGFRPHDEGKPRQTVRADPELPASCTARPALLRHCRSLDGLL
jgi:hypothetical protein